MLAWQARRGARHNAVFREPAGPGAARGCATKCSAAQRLAQLCGMPRYVKAAAQRPIYPVAAVPLLVLTWLTAKRGGKRRCSRGFALRSNAPAERHARSACLRSALCWPDSIHSVALAFRRAAGSTAQRLDSRFLMMSPPVHRPGFCIHICRAHAADDVSAESLLLVRGQKVMIDADLAQLYGVPTKALNQAVKRNAQRFPPDFMFQLTPAVKQKVVTDCDRLAKLKFSKSLPFAFTEHGGIQAANVINSEQAVEMGVYVVRAFVRLREMIGTNKELALRLDDLENKTELMSLKHDTFEHNTRVQLKQIFDAIRELMAAPEPAPKRLIGFVTPDDGPAKPKAAKEKK